MPYWAVPRFEERRSLEAPASPLPGSHRQPMAAPAGHDDQEDVRKAAAGDAAAFERLVLRYQDDVVNTAYYFLGNYDDAVDVAQDAFLKAYRGLSGFRGSSSFRTWILTIALNTARSLRIRSRAKKRSGKVIHLDAGAPENDEGAGTRAGDVPDPDTSSGPAVLLERKELKDALEKAISGLDDISREIIVLRDIEGESYDAIAEMLDLPLGTVKSRVHRARLEVQGKMTRWL